MAKEINHSNSNTPVPHISRWGIIYCPKQGVQHTHKRWEHIKDLLEQHQVAYDFVQSEGLDSVERLTKMLCSNGYETLIIVGGDSALNRALNGLLSLDETYRERIALGVIPNGRGNDFANFWGFTEETDERTIKSLISRRIRKVDVGFLQQLATAPEGEKHAPLYFLNCVNIGLVANIMKLKYKTRRLFGLATLSYFASMILLLFQRLETRMLLHINEETIQQKLMNVCVGNSRGYGQTPSAVPYNGCLDVTVISQPEIRQLVEGMRMLFTGKFLNHKDVRAYRTTRRVNFENINDAVISIDGRALNDIHAPFEIGLMCEHIQFIIPS